MVTLIKNIKVYQPEYAGIKDILLMGDKIALIDENIEMELPKGMELHVIDGKDKVAVPGFVDSHVHLMGGGGEGGFATRTPEATLTSLTTSGVTTVVGCIGTDGITRSMEGLLAKARGLEEEGVSTFVYTGSYQIPVRSLMNDVMKEIMMIDKIIGVGEIAISDHRSSQPTFEAFSKIAADARVGGMLSGKAGVLNIHLGDGERTLELLERVVEETEIPMSQFLPTHINRNAMLFERGVAYAKKGGTIDFTGNNDMDFWETISDEVRVCKGIKRLMEEGVDMDHFTISSDAQGSLPVFNEKQEFVGIGVGTATCLLKEIKECVFLEDIPLEIAIKGITSNPAKILKLKGKGHLAKGFDADICLLEEGTLDLDTVIAKGRVMVENKHPVVFGTFEENK